jgi:hypothetical protein
VIAVADSSSSRFWLCEPRTETHDHYTLIYGIIDHPNGSRGQDVAIVSLMHLRKSVLQHNVTYATALAHLSHRNAFDLTLHNADGSPPRHTLEAVTNETYDTNSKISCMHFWLSWCCVFCLWLMTRRVMLAAVGINVGCTGIAFDLSFLVVTPRGRAEVGSRCIVGFRVCVCEYNSTRCVHQMFSVVCGGVA